MGARVAAGWRRGKGFLSIEGAAVRNNPLGESFGRAGEW